MIVFDGCLGVEDMARHIPHVFDVPEDCTRIAIRFDHAPKHPGVGEIPHQLSLSLFDPDAGRGTRHNNADQTIVLSPGRASPGYLPGPLTPGQWCVFIDTHRILPPGGVRYRLTVELSDDAGDLPAPAPIPLVRRTAPRGPGWYRGDLHAHSLHSDARWPAADLAAYARRRRLDFAALTDHNTVSGLAEFDAQANDDLLTLGGMELTTFHGHAVSLGLRRFVDWRVRDGDTMGDVAERHQQAGAVFIIAHPMAPGHPTCTGCTWQYSDMLPGKAQGVEVWNGPWDGPANNEAALRRYFQWLNRGHRLIATTGSDSHVAYPDDARIGANVAYAPALEETAIVSAIARGHLYLSAGPGLILTARVGDAEVAMGDEAHDPQELRVDWSDVPDRARLRFLGAGRDGARMLTAHEVSGAGSVAIDPAVADGRPWIAVDLRDADGNLLALTNPIYCTW